MDRIRLLLLACVLPWAAQGLAADSVPQLLARAQQGDQAALSALRMQLAQSEESASAVSRVVESFRQGAVKGDARAQYEFAWLHEQGLGLPRDFRLAETWYRKSAEQGVVEAQYRLGRMYFEGEAVGSNRRQGYVWLAVAAAGGSRAAVPLRERAEATLAPVDLAKAKEEAKATAARIAGAAVPN